MKKKTKYSIYLCNCETLGLPSVRDKNNWTYLCFAGTLVKFIRVALYCFYLHHGLKEKRQTVRWANVLFSRAGHRRQCLSCDAGSQETATLGRSDRLITARRSRNGQLVVRANQPWAAAVTLSVRLHRKEQKVESVPELSRHFVNLCCV